VIDLFRVVAAAARRGAVFSCHDGVLTAGTQRIEVVSTSTRSPRRESSFATAQMLPHRLVVFCGLPLFYMCANLYGALVPALHLHTASKAVFVVLCPWTPITVMVFCPRTPIISCRILRGVPAPVMHFIFC